MQFYSAWREWKTSEVFGWSRKKIEQRRGRITTRFIFKKIRRAVEKHRSAIQSLLQTQEKRSKSADSEKWRPPLLGSFLGCPNPSALVSFPWSLSEPGLLHLIHLVPRASSPSPLL